MRNNATNPTNQSNNPIMISNELDQTIRERTRFERLLKRVEHKVLNNSAPTSTREATLLVKSLFTLKSQLTALETLIEPQLLAAYVKRVNTLWTLSKAERIIQSQQSKMRESTRTKTYQSDQAMFDEPPMIAASRVLMDPMINHANKQSNHQSIKETHPLANAAHFSITKPSDSINQMRNELFEGHSNDQSNQTTTQIMNDPGASLAFQYDEGLTRLAELAPALKHQVKSIADALHVDEAIVDEASRSMEDNVERVKRENVRLKAWTRASCSETCALSGIIVVLLAVFVGMVAIIKVVPAPR